MKAGNLTNLSLLGDSVSRMRFLGLLRVLTGLTGDVERYGLVRLTLDGDKKRLPCKPDPRHMSQSVRFLNVGDLTVNLAWWHPFNHNAQVLDRAPSKNTLTVLNAQMWYVSVGFPCA